MRVSKDRKDSIPDEVVKITPDMDVFPTIIHSDKWEDPIPMSSIINIAGLDDSPFITPDGDMFFFPFYFRYKKLLCRNNSQWREPERVILSKSISLDGCHFMQDDKLWFCSIRQGN